MAAPNLQTFQDRRHEEPADQAAEPTIVLAEPGRRRVRPGNVRATLRISIWEGILSSAMLGLVDGYLIPFAVALKASASQVANIGALPNLLAAFAQGQADLLKEWAGGKR